MANYARAETWKGPVIHWRAVIGAGVIAGIVFLMYEMIMMPLVMGVSPWAPPRMMAAIVLGEGVLPPPATFDLGIMMAAMMLHLVLSIIYAFIIAEAVQRGGIGLAIGIGALAGLVLYWINFYLFTSAFPWFAMARNWVSLTGHVLYGLVLGWAYRGLLRERAPAA